MKHVLAFFLLFICISGFSQDLIVTKSGDQIQCHILSIDTLKIIYRLRNESPRHEIARTEVENYYLSKATANELEWINRPYVEFFSLGFSGGVAYPTGDFASMDANSKLSGLASRGFFFNAELNFKLSKYIGLSATYMSQKHALNYLAVSNAYNSYFGTSNFTAGGGDWLINGILFGLNFDLPLKQTEGLSITGYFDAGVPKFTFPEQYVEGNPNPQIYVGTTKLTMSEVKTNSGAIKFGLGLRYKLNKYIALHLSGSYFSAHPSFFNIYISSTNGYSDTINYEQEIKTLNLQAGLSFLFYRK